MKNSELKPGKLYKCIEQITFLGNGGKMYLYSDEFNSPIFLFLYKEVISQKNNKYYYLIDNKIYYNWIGQEEEMDDDWFDEILEKA